MSWGRWYAPSYDNCCVSYVTCVSCLSCVQLQLRVTLLTLIWLIQLACWAERKSVKKVTAALRTSRGYLSLLLATTSSLSQKLLPAHSTSWTQPSRHFVLVLPILFYPTSNSSNQEAIHTSMFTSTVGSSASPVLPLRWLLRVFIFRLGWELKLRDSHCWILVKEVISIRTRIRKSFMVAWIRDFLSKRLQQLWSWILFRLWSCKEVPYKRGDKRNYHTSSWCKKGFQSLVLVQPSVF